MTDDYTALRALAEAALDDPEAAREWYTEEDLDSALDATSVADAEYIAAANPARILALLADLDAARAALELSQITVAEDVGRRVMDLTVERDALAAKVEVAGAMVANMSRQREADDRIITELRRKVRDLGGTP